MFDTGIAMKGSQRGGRGGRGGTARSIERSTLEPVNARCFSSASTALSVCIDFVCDALTQ
jgi:hypothetical protein